MCVAGSNNIVSTHHFTLFYVYFTFHRMTFISVINDRILVKSFKISLLSLIKFRIKHAIKGAVLILWHQQQCISFSITIPSYQMYALLCVEQDSCGLVFKLFFWYLVNLVFNDSSPQLLIRVRNFLTKCLMFFSVMALNLWELERPKTNQTTTTTVTT